MSSDTDRIPVPTNGRGPHRARGKTSPATPATPASPATPADDADTPAVDTHAGEPTSAEFSVAFSPKQVAVGFGIIASLILLVVGARRRGKSR